MPDSVSAIEDQITPEEQLNIRIVWYYYITEMTQQQIADRFGITRVRVNKALAACRESGVVQIRINSKLASCIRLEHELQKHYGLSEVIVVPSPENEKYIFRVLGVGAAPYIHDQVYKDCNLGVGWGRTLRATVRETRGRSFASMSTISLMGGLNYGSGFNTVEITHDFAKLFGGNYYFLAAPVYADSEESRNMIFSQPSIRDIYQKARNVDLALVTVGDLSKRSLMIELGLVSEKDAKLLRAAGAVGDLLGHYLNGNGEEVDHPLNRQAISLSLKDIGRIKKIVLVSGGSYKAEIIQAVLRRKLPHVLVIDEATAMKVLGKLPPT